MSFREVKSMLRMINIHMDDGYAYKLFKVPVLHPVTCVPRRGRCVLFCLPKHEELSDLSHPKPPTLTTRNGWIHDQWLDLPVIGLTANGWIDHQWLDPPPMIGSTISVWIHHQ